MIIRKYMSGVLAGASLFAVGAPALADPGVTALDSGSSSAFSLTDQRVGGADLPAVSGLNGALAANGGVVGTSTGVVALSGDLAAPLSHSIGLQIDAALGYSNNELHGGTSGQIFWRNPNAGLFGIYGSYSFVRDLNGSYHGTDRTFSLERGGVNAAVYNGRFTVEGIFGVETGSLATRFFDTVDIAYYPEDNLKLSVGHRYTDDIHYGNVTAEYQLPSSGHVATSLYADASYSSAHEKAIWAGVRVHFGSGAKTLIRRDREDDPTTLINFDANVLTTCQQGASVPEAVPAGSPIVANSTCVASIPAG